MTNYKIRRVFTLQPDSKERLRGVRWFQAFDLSGRPLTSPQPTKALCISTIHPAYK